MALARVTIEVINSSIFIDMAKILSLNEWFMVI